MKKLIITALALTIGMAAFAQSNDIMKARHQFRMEQNARVPQIKANIPMAPAVKGAPATKGQTASALPTQRWFPGEWEEVQAIVITWAYDCYPADHVGDQYYTAQPVFTGYGDCYHYTTSGWQETGFGPIVGVPDTTQYSSMYQDYADFRDVWVELAKGIQLGGAQVWFNVWNAEDSNIIKRYMARVGAPLTNYGFIVSAGNSFWYRDCGPICFYYGDQDSVAMLDFMYYPGRALDDSLPYAIEAQMGIPNFETQIEWEGGNCLVDGAGFCLSSDALYANNTDRRGQLTWDGSNDSSITYVDKTPLTQQQVRDSMHYLIGTREMRILPTFKYDGGTGHVDLYADMWDENEFVFSKMPEVYSSWYDYAVGEKNMDSLCSYTSIHGLNYKQHGLPFPCTDNGGNFRSQRDYNSSYTRTYSNHTFVNNVILQPVFSKVVNGLPTAEWDLESFYKIQAAYPGYTIYPIDVRTFDGSGGAIHCITKQIPADNPVRILHPSITGNTGNDYTTTNAPIRANVTNRSGIESVTLYWRTDEGGWNEVALTADAQDTTLFTGEIPTSTLTVGEMYTEVEYYLSATSNNGKTITKPMTANQGGYYTFYLGTNPDLLDIEAVEEDGFSQFYPNPATDKASINIDLANGKRYNVQIVDMMGRTVHQSTLSASGSIVYTIDTQKLGHGIYNVVFSNEGQKVVRRIVVR